MTEIPSHTAVMTDSAMTAVTPLGAERPRIYDIPREVDPTATRAEEDDRTVSEKRHPFRNITLENGKTLTVPTARAADMENPLHVGVTGNPASTPGYFRLLIPAFMARYFARAVCDWSFGLDKHNPDKEGMHISNAFSKFVDDRVKDGVSPIRRFVDAAEHTENLATVLSQANHEVQGSYQNAIEHLQKIEGYQKAITKLVSVGYENNPEGRLVDLCHQFISREAHKEEAKAIKSTFTKLKENGNPAMPFEFSERIFKYITTGENIDKPGQNWKSSINKIESVMNSNLRGMAFDASVGLISFGVTGFYAKRVAGDIYNLFSEAYAYEKYVPPEKVKFHELFSSDNKIIQKACGDFWRKNLVRAATDTAFFARLIPTFTSFLPSWQRFPVAEAALGVKGMLLLAETSRKQTSFLVDLTDIVDRKLNPQHGLGDPMRAADLLDLYQKYNLDHNPDALFKDATSHDAKDNANWRLSNTVFARMAELMNDTYKYKHGFRAETDGLEQLQQEILSENRYFTMPKYLYLLGHDLIDLAQPEKTLAYVEIANTYGIQAVKDVRTLLEDKHIPLETVLETYVVDMERTLNGNTSPALKAISERAREVDHVRVMEYLEDHPDVAQHYNDLVKKKQEKTPHSPSASQMEATPAATVSVPSFFPAHAESLPHHSNDAQAPSPSTIVTDADMGKRLIPTLVVQTL